MTYEAAQKWNELDRRREKVLHQHRRMQIRVRTNGKERKNHQPSTDRCLANVFLLWMTSLRGKSCKRKITSHNLYVSKYINKMHVLLRIICHARISTTMRSAHAFGLCANHLLRYPPKWTSRKMVIIFTNVSEKSQTH